MSAKRLIKLGCRGGKVALLLRAARASRRRYGHALSIKFGLPAIWKCCRRGSWA